AHRWSRRGQGPYPSMGVHARIAFLSRRDAPLAPGSLCVNCCRNGRRVVGGAARSVCTGEALPRAMGITVVSGGCETNKQAAAPQPSRQAWNDGGFPLSGLVSVGHGGGGLERLPAKFRAPVQALHAGSPPPRGNLPPCPVACVAGSPCCC